MVSRKQIVFVASIKLLEAITQIIEIDRVKRGGRVDILRKTLQ